jgi:glycosyltransferase involved in cell wall biosynthesis
MRIALIASVAATVPPAAPHGVEGVIGELAKMLTRLGHSVAVYASGDSRPPCTLNWRIPRATSGADAQRELRHLAYAWGDITSRAIPFDVVHAHHASALPLRGAARVPTVFTLHHERDEGLMEHYSAFPDIAYVAMNDAQVVRMPELKFRAVIHAGLDPDDYPRGEAGDYCAFLGDLRPEQAPHLAVDAARLAGVPLKLGATEHTTSSDYFASEMLPRLDAAAGTVEWLGDLAGDRRLTLLQRACALLIPSECQDPTGIVAIQAMLTGTPVIALAGGIASELVNDGVTGFLVHGVKEMAARLRGIGTLDRTRCRERAIQRWGSLRMASEYEGIYEDLLRAQRPPRDRRARAPIPAAITKSIRRFSGLFSPLWDT